jgi:hypothetical protein
LRRDHALGGRQLCCERSALRAFLVELLAMLGRHRVEFLSRGRQVLCESG